MLGFVQRWFSAKAHPIGVDMGSDTLRLAQVQPTRDAFRLMAAASCDAPPAVRNNPAARAEFLTRTLRDLVAQGAFRGRQAVLALPASLVQLYQYTADATDAGQTRRTLLNEAAGRLAIAPDDVVIHQIVTGSDSGKRDVIAAAGHRAPIDACLQAAAGAGLDVVAMNSEPQAIVDCFGHLFRRESERHGAVMYVDIGLNGARAVVGHDGRIILARSLKYGGDWFNRAVAAELGMSITEAKAVRIRSSRNELVNDPTILTHQPGDEQLDRQIEQACDETVHRLAEELDLCRRYCESGSAGVPVQRVVFIGGEARDRGLCRAIARALKLPAQVGDPLNRIGRATAGICIDRRTIQPAWAVALGLSMGPLSEQVAQ